ncbi:MAG: glycosyltransferase family 39 protein [Fibrobacteria bacterium]
MISAFPGGSRYRLLVAALAVAMVIQLLFALVIAKGNPAYFGHYHAQIHPDAQHYMVLAENFWEGRGFSRMDAPPYQPDALRTPGYIAVAGPLWLSARMVWPLYLFNALCHLITAVLVYRMAAAFLGHKAALAAAAFFALDLMLASLVFETMTEPFFNLLWVLGAVLFLEGFPRFRNGKGGAMRLAGAGAVLGFAVLVRPAGLYIPLVLAAAAAVTPRTRKEAVNTARAMALFLPAALLVMIPWMARNQKTFGIFRLSTVDAINMVYYAGAGPYQLEYGLSLPEAQKRISQDYHLASNWEYHNPWNTGKTIRQLDEEIRAVTRPVLLRDVPRLALATLIGVSRSAFAHTADNFSEMAGRAWVSPGMGNLAHGKWGEFAKRLRLNPAWSVAVFAIELMQACLLWPLFLIGCAGLGWRFLRGHRFSGMPLLLCAYFLATMGAGGMDATARFRASILPLAYVLAAQGALYVGSMLRRGSREKRAGDTLEGGNPVGSAAGFN